MPLLEPALTQQICHYERVTVYEPIRLRAILGLEADRLNSRLEAPAGLQITLFEELDDTD